MNRIAFNLFTVLAALFMNQTYSAPSKRAQQNDWKAEQLERIILPGQIDEGVAFVKRTRGPKLSGYTISYFVGSQSVRERGLPAEMHQDLIQQLQAALRKSEEYNGFSCTNHVVFEQIKDFKRRRQVINYCLTPAGNEAFSDWYQKARKLLSL